MRHLNHDLEGKIDGVISSKGVKHKCGLLCLNNVVLSILQGVNCQVFEHYATTKCRMPSGLKFLVGDFLALFLVV